MSRAFSEEEDDPAVYESSGSEWNSSSEYEVKQKRGRRSSGRVAGSAKKGRKKHDTTSSEESEEESDEEPQPRKKNGVNKKQKVEPKSDSEATAAVEERRDLNSIPKMINTKDFATGSFLILKKDIQSGDAKKKKPCIWRVDGKALLQKYIPFDDNGVLRHKTTSTYTGWSALDRDMYAPVSVTIKQNKDLTLIVDLDWDKLKEITIDSD